MKNESIKIEKDNPIFVYIPDYKWYFTLGGEYGVRVMVEKAPNAFIRFMQKHILGMHWTKL